jgi:hypothetical protein
MGNTMKAIRYDRYGRRYDLLIDVAGNRTLPETRRVLVPIRVLAGVGGPDKGRWIGPLGRTVRMALLSPAVSQRMSDSGMKMVAGIPAE